MNVVYTVTLALLGAAALMTTARLVRGPTVFDRIMAVDVLSVLLVSGVAVHAAVWGEPAHGTILVVIALLGFVGSVTAARLAAQREGSA
ncbi:MULTISPECIES: monovalent cation/H+ antiporter complex subunit F [Actinomadura]|uniref:Multisubunit sodium/proton antiporter, MrpF subunit n=1 Tax=Actinomadura madurae TaxID=1993 RepID=A0A1I4WQI7_9ACTN|nr:monovalent cation/H+ antiporter complex subunit F [Actinomadura madurae]MCP9954709.1 monovalent cation/H+ antiporter complex subunit F [Actinomadura madurae]MCP9971448.1 monovalent cation/H+ antiporter complex subunit F [Actinomadura madurae]MCP9983939.1 monovalent cation/H+ antiporter complex subunit F [Actinomadura madurae]MCQ0004495.1 monovalent cation/H+ antiporter complex subunit F [Actinomadura madurae]MCQ0020172.1 monovalent cation/H+ antiporter complex subunit F [Actinomadura madura